MTAPDLIALPLWDRFQETAFRIVSRALLLLDAGDPDTDEFELNRRLARSIVEANWQMDQEDGSGMDHLPSYDGHPMPFRADGDTTDYEKVRPDFTWTLHDTSAPSPEAGFREFVVECKRIGEEPGGRRFDQLYVSTGIMRFVSDSHRYGASGTRGVMVGYLQRSDGVSVRISVDSHCESAGLTPLDGEAELEQPLAILSQMHDRDFGETPFMLHHLWRDLRA